MRSSNADRSRRKHSTRTDKPTKAAEGFARAKGVSREDLEVRDHEGQQFVFAVHSKEGRPTLELLPEICQEILHGITFPKTMRWDSAELRFSRPVRWLVDQVRRADGEIRGRRHHERRREPRPPIPRQRLASRSAKPPSYRGMHGGSQGHRRPGGASPRPSWQGWPSSPASGALLSSIPPASWKRSSTWWRTRASTAATSPRTICVCPSRVLTTCMQSHQRYFPLTAEDGSLAAGLPLCDERRSGCAAEHHRG